MGIMSSSGLKNSSIALIVLVTLSKVTRKKLLMLFESVWGSHVGGVRYRCVLSMLDFSSKVVASLIVARVGDSLKKAILTICQKFLGMVSSTTLFQ